MISPAAWPVRPALRGRPPPEGYHSLAVSRALRVRARLMALQLALPRPQPAHGANGTKKIDPTFRPRRPMAHPQWVHPNLERRSPTMAHRFSAVSILEAAFGTNSASSMLRSAKRSSGTRTMGAKGIVLTFRSRARIIRSLPGAGSAASSNGENPTRSSVAYLVCRTPIY